MAARAKAPSTAPMSLRRLPFLPSAPLPPPFGCASAGFAGSAFASFAGFFCSSLMALPLLQRAERRRFMGFVVAAAERAREAYAHVETACGEIRLEVPLRQHLRLGAEDLQVVAEAFAVAQQREAVAVLRDAHARFRLGALAIDGAHRRELVDHIA